MSPPGLLATCPEVKLRNPQRAAELAKKAVELAPSGEGFWNTLGTAQYRAGDWQEATAALMKSIELRKECDGFDGFVLAMAHWQLGHKEEARKWFDQAVTWMEKNQPQNEELQQFRTEATELLGISDGNSKTDAK